MKVKDEWAQKQNAIRKFCYDNGYDYEKLMKLVISMVQNFIAFVGFDHDTDGDCGLQKDVSGNIVLIVEKKNDKLEFTVTEHTDSYIG